MRELFTTYPTQLLGGGLLVLLGILVRFFPNLIAGYNTMSAEQKKNVDVKGLSRFMCLSLAAIGIGWIALGMLAGKSGRRKMGFGGGFSLAARRMCFPLGQSAKIRPQQINRAHRTDRTYSNLPFEENKKGRKTPYLQPFLILGVQVLTRRDEDRTGHTLCISHSG